MSDFPIAALPFLRCPVCRAGFVLRGRSLRCAHGHTYDVARQGYVNLLPGGARPGTADTAAMVAAREAFLATGHFADLRELVADLAEEAPPGDRARCFVEAGAGTGYYLAGVLDRFPTGVGLALDISRYAARRAARAHERMAAIVCDGWKELPIADEASHLVLDIFAPRNASEFRRILEPEGRLIVVTPTGRHLRELVTGLGLLTVDEDKPERLEQALAADFSLVERTEYEKRLLLKAVEAAALAAMGPSARHLRPEEVAARLSMLGVPITATFSVTAATYAPRRP